MHTGSPHRRVGARPITGDELRAIKRYLAVREARLPWLFVSERGQPFTRLALRRDLAGPAGEQTEVCLNDLTDSVQPRFGLNADSDSSNPAMGCTSASRRGGPAGARAVSPLSPSGPSALAAIAASTECTWRISQRSGSLLRFARSAARPYRLRSSGGNYSSLLPIGCTLISNRGTTEGASPNSPPPGQDRGALTLRAGGPGRI